MLLILFVAVLRHPKHRAKLPQSLSSFAGPWKTLPARDVPEWCAELIDNPRLSGILKGYCRERGRYSVGCLDNKPRFFSQYHQDMLLYLHTFKYLDLAEQEKICTFVLERRLAAHH